MLIGAKSSHNHCLVCGFYTINFKNKIKFENKLFSWHIIKFNILLYKCSKYEIILLPFGPSNAV
jgi:hypothetical protein